jgi:hypothetical protein
MAPGLDVETWQTPQMAPQLSKIQRTELQNIIISKLQGEEVITDKEIAKTIVPLHYPNRT